MNISNESSIGDDGDAPVRDEHQSVFSPVGSNPTVADLLIYVSDIIDPLHFTEENIFYYTEEEIP